MRGQSLGGCYVPRSGSARHARSRFPRGARPRDERDGGDVGDVDSGNRQRPSVTRWIDRGRRELHRDARRTTTGPPIPIRIPTLADTYIPAAASDLSSTSGQLHVRSGLGRGHRVERRQPVRRGRLRPLRRDVHGYGTASPLGITTGRTSYANPTLFDSSGTAHSSDALTGLPWIVAAYDLPNLYFFIEVYGAGAEQFIELRGTITESQRAARTLRADCSAALGWCRPTP